MKQSIQRSEHFYKVRHMFVAIGLVFTLCGNSQTILKDSIQVNKYLKEAGKVKAPAVQIITDAKKVAFISAYIDAKNKEKADAQNKLDAERNRLPGIRYKNGDQSAVSEIVAILKSNDSVKIAELYEQLNFDYDETGKIVNTLHPEISAQLFARVDNDQTEKAAVQFLGYNNIEGSKAVFEKRLFSGKSTDEDRIAYWLTSDNQSPKTIDFISDNYKRNPKYFDDKYWMAGTLNDYFKNASEQEKAKILEIAYSYLGSYKGAPATGSDTESEIENHFQTFYAIAIKHGKLDRMKAVIQPLVKRYNEQPGNDAITEADMEQALEMLFIRDLEPKQQKELAISMMATQDLYFEGLDAMHEVPALASDPEMIKKAFLLLQLAKEKTETEKFVQYFKKLTPAEFATYALGIRSIALRKELIDRFTINAKTFEENNEYLFSQGLTDKKITDADIANYKKSNADFEKDDSMYSVMQLAGINVNFDTETGMVPVDYDTLLAQFSSASKGKLGPFKMHVQSHYDNKKEMYDYRFLVVANNKCYVMVPEDSGDWYDMTAFSKLLDTLVADAKITERFVPIETGGQDAWYVFAEPNKAKHLIDTYKLAADISPNEE